MGMQVRRMSAKKIVQPVIFDNLKNAVPGGLYDSAMGPVDTRGRCVDKPGLVLGSIPCLLAFRGYLFSA
eukprot:1152216-Pelagomonas_calceolata.AAC.7